MVFCSFLGFADNCGDAAWPQILAAIVLCMFYSFTYTLICPGKKQISDMTSVWCFFFFLEIWLFIFSLERIECLSKVSALGFWETYPGGMSVTLHSPQVSLGNVHIMAFVDRLLGLTVNMFEKLSSWWKKNVKREPPYIWNSMLNCKYILKMQKPPFSSSYMLTMTAWEGRIPKN